MHLQIELSTQNMERVLSVLKRALNNQTALLKHIGEELINANRARHEAGVAPDGTPWKPLSASTLGTIIWNKNHAILKKTGKRRIGGSHSLSIALKVRTTRKPLWDTKEMLGSHFHPQVNGNTLRIGFDIDRALWHHEGTKPYEIRPKVAKALAFGGVVAKRVHHPGLPARPLLGMPAADERLVEKAVEAYLQEALNRAGVVL